MRQSEICVQVGVVEKSAYGMTELYGHYDKNPIQVNIDDLFLYWDVSYEPGWIEILEDMVNQAAFSLGLEETANLH